MINLYSPTTEIELAMIKSILVSKEINYFVKNENFGSLEVGPQIALFNRRMIMYRMINMRGHLNSSKITCLT